MAKKKALFFATCDVNNYKYAIKFWNSMVKFHSPKDIDMVLYTDEKRPEELKKLPEGIKVIDLEPFLKDDPHFFYRQKPIIAEIYIKDYELVCGFDVDQIVCGSLDYCLSTTDYDVGTVINWNKTDPKQYGYVQGWGILPPEYFNCGFVALRSEKFVHHWKVLCFGPQFDRLQYREQDLLNILAHYGNYNVRCFDHQDPIAGMTAWWGLIGKSEWHRSILTPDKKIIIPDSPDRFPDKPTELKIIHFAGGNNPQKFNYKTMFPDEVSEHLDYLVSSK